MQRAWRRIIKPYRLREIASSFSATVPPLPRHRFAVRSLRPAGFIFLCAARHGTEVPPTPLARADEVIE
jgi:hypothetical protein